MKASGLAQACADVPDANQSQALVNAVAAAAIVAPETTTPVAILDTGVDPNTSELRGRVLPGFNAATGSNDTSDIDAHGTEVAAVAAARAGRFQGISPTSPILPIAIYNRSSETTAAWVVRGIQEAVTRGAGVINLSSSNPAADVDPKDAAVLDQAITAAFAAGHDHGRLRRQRGQERRRGPGQPHARPHRGLGDRRRHPRRLLELRPVDRPRQPRREHDPARAAGRVHQRLRRRLGDVVLRAGRRRRRRAHLVAAPAAERAADLRRHAHGRGQGPLPGRPRRRLRVRPARRGDRHQQRRPRSSRPPRSTTTSSGSSRTRRSIRPTSRRRTRRRSRARSRSARTHRTSSPSTSSAARR